MGRRVWFNGTGNRNETKRMAQKLEDDARQVSLGYRDPAQEYQKHKSKLFDDAAAEYMAWGKSQGGIKGRPWGEHHARKREFYLKFWGKELKLQTLADLDGILPAVESTLQKAIKESEA